MTIQSSPTVFISYARDNRDLLAQVVGYLKEEKIIPKYDVQDFGFAKKWRDEIKDYIDICDTMIVLMTEQAASSIWVLSEVLWGLARDKSPIILMTPGAKLPDQISDLHAAALSGDYFADAELMKKVVQKIWDVVSGTTNDEDDLTDGADEWYLSIINKEIVRDDPNPNTEAIEKKAKTPPKQKFQKGAARRIIANEIKQKGQELTSAPLYDFKRIHQQQWKRGRILSRWGDKHPYYQELTSEIPVSGKRLIASRFPITNGLYRQHNPSYSLDDDQYDNEPWLINTKNLAIEILPQVYKAITSLAKWLEDKLFDEELISKRGEVRLPTRDEWCALAEQKNKEWTREQIRGSNVKFSPSSQTRLAAVGVYPASCSSWGCFDVIGNAWELCAEKSSRSSLPEFFVMGWCYLSIVSNVEAQWNRYLSLLRGLPRGEPVTVRYVVEIDE